MKRETLGYQSMLEKLPLLQPVFFRAILAFFLCGVISSINARRLFLHINKHKIFWSSICFYSFHRACYPKYLQQRSESGHPGIFKKWFLRHKVISVWLTSHFVHVFRRLSSLNLLVPICLRVPIFSNRAPANCIFYLILDILCSPKSPFKNERQNPQVGYFLLFLFHV